VYSSSLKTGSWSIAIRENTTSAGRLRFRWRPAAATGHPQLHAGHKTLKGPPDARALVTAVIYFGSFLAIGLIAKTDDRPVDEPQKTSIFSEISGAGRAASRPSAGVLSVGILGAMKAPD